MFETQNLIEKCCESSSVISFEKMFSLVFLVLAVSWYADVWANVIASPCDRTVAKPSNVFNLY